jgi:hypothetical protein
VGNSNEFRFLNAYARLVDVNTKKIVKIHFCNKETLFKTVNQLWIINKPFIIIFLRESTSPLTSPKCVTNEQSNINDKFFWTADKQ